MRKKYIPPLLAALLAAMPAQAESVKSNIEPAYAACMAQCNDPGRLAKLTQEGCLKSCAELRREFAGKSYYSMESCLDAAEKTELDRDLLLEEHDEWCAEQWDHLYKRKGCRDAATAFYSHITPAEFCGDYTRSRASSTPLSPPQSQAEPLPPTMAYGGAPGPYAPPAPSMPGQGLGRPIQDTPKYQTGKPKAASGAKPAPTTAKATPKAAPAPAKAPVQPGAANKTAAQATPTVNAENATSGQAASAPAGVAATAPLPDSKAKAVPLPAPTGQTPDLPASPVRDAAPNEPLFLPEPETEPAPAQTPPAAAREAATPPASGCPPVPKAEKPITAPGQNPPVPAGSGSTVAPASPAPAPESMEPAVPPQPSPSGAAGMAIPASGGPAVMLPPLEFSSPTESASNTITTGPLTEPETPDLNTGQKEASPPVPSLSRNTTNLPPPLGDAPMAETPAGAGPGIAPQLAPPHR